MKIKLYLFDYIFIGLALATVVFVIFAVSNRAVVTGRNVLLTVRVTSDQKSIVDMVPNDKKVYFDSVNQSVDFVSAGTIGGDYLITLRAKGNLTSDQITFDGVRVLLGQKAEIHANYFAQGIITKAVYE